MKYYGGCDSGSTYTKCVIIDETGKMVADVTLRSRINAVLSCEESIEKAVAQVPDLNSAEREVLMASLSRFICACASASLNCFSASLNYAPQNCLRHRCLAFINCAARRLSLAPLMIILIQYKAATASWNGCDCRMSGD